VLKKIPTLKTVDGFIVDEVMIEKIKQLGDAPTSVKQV